LVDLDISKGKRVRMFSVLWLPVHLKAAAAAAIEIVVIVEVGVVVF
jgi:hypothetical protein